MIQGLRVSPEELHDLLVTQLELLGESEFEKTRLQARRLKVPLERMIVERSHIPYTFLLGQLAQTWNLDFVDLKISEIKSEAMAILSEKFARANLLMPFDVGDGWLDVAMWDPRDSRIIDQIRQITRREVRPHLALLGFIQRAHLLYHGDLRAMLQRQKDPDLPSTNGPHSAKDDDRSAVELLDRVLKYAAVARASDIHIEPFEIEAVVRCRIDGFLHEILTLPIAALTSFISRIKILAGMRIDERRVPQDGRFEADLGGFKVDLRVSSLATHWGEKIVMRVLPTETIPIAIEDLGMAGSDLDILQRMIHRPHGMILITGPTGSGKTTSLYAIIMRMGVERQNVVNISTIEDPIEYTLPRINQIPLNLAAGIDFASGLRALLRQDPDIIMVGEIRDRETAEIAVRTALVGRLLLSTLHTNDATAAVPRLMDIGVEPFLIASTLNLVIGQRLVRRICVRCRESAPLDPAIAKTLSSRPDYEDTVRVLQREGILTAAADPLSGVLLFHGKGCDLCAGSGFLGRLGVFEMFEVKDNVRSLIMQRADGLSIRAAAISNGMKTMFQDGLGKAFLGETTLEEVFRTTM
jgi:type II secretory ATPase GspE/PulE/Tfp pilus assembly ATPase PilB-like protein